MSTIFDIRGRKGHVVVASINQSDDCDLDIRNIFSMRPSILLIRHPLLSMFPSRPVYASPFMSTIPSVNGYIH